MRRYFEKLQAEKTPHERRQVAMRIATVVTAFVFVAWVATLGVRLTLKEQEIVQGGQGENTAAALYAVQGEPTLGN